ncbi:nicotinate-nucleotide--dimethylbenzimidazole phosphoribosyltransferase [Evansella clarkii]|uniref:nicotinate-nucleotide--dimethylbenzimidazole phosphoribosyltransferase n=1 Tax=Evansella clarkii TaxID=79879 RepID=UPI001FD55489|nr:nicotinate-nucleotide--dimethylbenzimidazole phosphoribosyltransferase [Evansella clarkii]
MKNTINRIKPADKTTGNEVSAYLDTLTKPKGSLGRLEDLAVQLGEITSSRFPEVTPPGIIVFAADHGIAKEGVSAYPQEVTAQMVQNFLNGGAAINVLAEQTGAMLEVVDIGIANDISNEKLINRKLCYGTANFLEEDAMSKEEAEASIKTGMEIGGQLISKGAECIIPGEMGIGNTTSSSAILSVISGEEPGTLTGAGTGLSLEQLKHKQRIIEQAISRRKPDRDDPLDILSKLGGFEIAGMTGAILEAASRRKPVLIDGFISSVSALLAVKLCGNVKDYLIIGHHSQEAGHKTVIRILEKQPLLDLQLRLGEGTGAALAFPLLEASSRLLKQMATFSSAGVAERNRP